MMGTNWPTRADARHNMPRQSRKGSKVASRRTYESRRKHAVAGKLDQLLANAERKFRPRTESGEPWSPDKGTVVEGCPTVMVGGGPSPNDRSVGRSPSPDETTRFVTDGNNEARDLRRKAVVRAMIKAR